MQGCSQRHERHRIHSRRVEPCLEASAADIIVAPAQTGAANAARTATTTSRWHGHRRGAHMDGGGQGSSQIPVSEVTDMLSGRESASRLVPCPDGLWMRCGMMILAEDSRSALSIAARQSGITKPMDDSSACFVHASRLDCFCR